MSTSKLPFTLLSSSGYKPKNKWSKKTPSEFFHPNVIVDRYCRVLFLSPYPRLERELTHQMILRYLCDSGYTRPNLLCIPPRNIAVLIDTCSYIFSAPITSLFRQDMESFCASYGEKTTKEGGVAYSLFVFPSDDGADERHATLEEWIKAMVYAVCKEYNRKLDRKNKDVGMKTAGIVQRDSFWKVMKERILKATGADGGIGWRQGKGFGIAAWVYSVTKKSER